MLKTKILFFITAIVSQLAFSQSGSKEFIPIEKLILKNQFDSAQMELNKITNEHSNSAYYESLERIINQNSNYNDLQLIGSIIPTHGKENTLELHSFFKEYLIPPSNLNQIDIDYVNAKWRHISILSEELMFSLSDEEYTSLKNYVAHFENTTSNEKRAQFLLNIYRINNTLNEQNIDLGVELCAQNMDIAKELNDTTLMIMSDYYLNAVWGGIPEMANQSTELAQKSIELDLQLEQRSEYYILNVLQIIENLIYEHSNDSSLMPLLNEVYDTPEYREISYHHYAYYIGILPKGAPQITEILQKFESDDIIRFCDTIIHRSKNKLIPYDYYNLLESCAYVLETHGYLHEAIEMKDSVIYAVEDIYTQDLAKSIAFNEVGRIEDSKKEAIRVEQEKTKMQRLVSVFMGFVILLAIIGIFYLRKTNHKLATQKNEILKKEQEKEILLKEIHHRVKNNFQIVSSIFKSQSIRSNDQDFKQLMNDGQNRIKSMAMIHEKLYQTKDFRNINFKDYTNDLIENINQTNKTDQDIKWDIAIPPIHFHIDIAVPLGLILNELITNCYKYAFRSKPFGSIDINLNSLENDSYELVVSDNGNGMPINFDLQKSTSLGLNMVNGLAWQLNGNMKFDTGDFGTKFSIFFKNHLTETNE